MDITINQMDILIDLGARMDPWIWDSKLTLDSINMEIPARYKIINLDAKTVASTWGLKSTEDLINMVMVIEHKRQKDMTDGDARMERLICAIRKIKEETSIMIEKIYRLFQ